jgi:hypothetical protein
MVVGERSSLKDVAQVLRQCWRSRENESTDLLELIVRWRNSTQPSSPFFAA